MSRNSITPSRAFFTIGVLVLMTLGRAVLVGGQVVDAHGAGGDGLGAALHLDQAHAAVAGDRQALVVAEARDLDAGLLAGLDQRDAVLDLHGRAVDDQLLGHSPLRILALASRRHAAPAGLAVKRISTPRTRPARPNQKSMGS